MVLVEASKVLDEAQFVKANEIHSEVSIIQVWYGGVEVRVFEVDLHNEWREVEVWSISDDRGRPVGVMKIEELMEQHFEIIKESFEAVEEDL